MDRITKSLLKIPTKQRQKILEATEKILQNDLSGLDVRKLTNSDGAFRVRIGEYRVIFKKLGQGQVIVLEIAKRDDRTYK